MVYQLVPARRDPSPSRDHRRQLPHRLPLSRNFGGGTLSSSDGQLFPVAVITRNATALPRYFGLGRGLSFFSWTSDQYSQYGSKVAPSTSRDATYVLDEILDNETELPIVEHATDTAGYTEMLFALFDLLGLQFAPRIRDLGEQRLYRMDRTKTCQHIEPLLKGVINQDLITSTWDDLLRVAGSLKRGWVTSSLFISRMQAYPRQNALARPAGIWPPREDPLHFALSGEPGLSAAHPHPAEQR